MQKENISLLEINITHDLSDKNTMVKRPHTRSYDLFYYKSNFENNFDLKNKGV